MSEDYGEPWVDKTSTFGDTIDDRDGNLIAYGEGELDRVDSRGEGLTRGRRIVACVNACAGIPSDMLEEAGFGNVLSIGVTNLTAERDSLRSVLAEKTAQVERLREVCQKLADSSEFHMRGLRVKCGPCSEYLRLAREALAATAPATHEAAR